MYLCGVTACAMKMNRLLYYFAICAVLFYAAVACVPELPTQETNNDSVEGKPVTFSFSVPATEMMPATRALGEEGELKTLHLAVFGSSGYLKEYVQAEKKSLSEGIYTFQVTLTGSAKPRKIHFIGNGPETIPFGYDTMLKSLLAASASPTDPKGPAFWQMKEVDKIDAQTASQIGLVMLVRNWAKISLVSDDENFTPKSFAVVNAPNKGTIVPCFWDTNDKNETFIDNYLNLSLDDLKHIKRNGEEGDPYPGNLPEDIKLDSDITYETSDFDPNNPNTEKGVVKYDKDNPPAVYLYERPIPSEQLAPTFVIVYGYYKDGKVENSLSDYYFYKLDLATPNDNGVTEYYPVYRNFEYRIEIKHIENIGVKTPEAAIKSAGSADISADVTTSHVGDISDGTARLAVQPWMSKTFNEGGKTISELSVKFFSKVTEGPNMDLEAVSFEIERAEDGGSDIIKDVAIGSPSEDGWRKITFKTIPIDNNFGPVARSQKLKIKGEVKNQGVVERTLYREIVITLLPAQKMVVKCKDPIVANQSKEPVQVDISIPVGLSREIFPLDFIIEPEDRTLMPDYEWEQSHPGEENDLPIITGRSISDNMVGANTFQFKRTVTWEEYSSVETRAKEWVSPDDDEEIWRPLSCHFITTRTENATTIWVASPETQNFFIKTSDSFENTKSKFQNLRFNSSIPVKEGKEVNVHFDVEESYKYSYPKIKMVLTGMSVKDVEAQSALVNSLVPSESNETKKTYIFTPKQESQDILCETLVTEGEVSVSLDDVRENLDDRYRYEHAELYPHHFTYCQFLDGVGVKSNVVFGLLNTDVNKATPFGFFHEPGYPVSSPILLKNVDDHTNFNGLNGGGLSGGKAKFSSFTKAQGDTTYHEIAFTSKGNSRIGFRMIADGYVEKVVSAGRFFGNIGNWNDPPFAIDVNTVLKEGNSYRFSTENKKFDFPKANGNADNNLRVEVSFDRVSSLEKNGVSGLWVDPDPLSGSNEVTMSIESRDISGNTGLLYFVEITFSDGYAPTSFTPSEQVRKYPGTTENRYIWLIPKHALPTAPETETKSLTIKSEGTMHITKIIIKTIVGFEEK